VSAAVATSRAAADVDAAAAVRAIAPEASSVALKGLSVILFEDGDLLLEEDRGFVAALAALIADSKVGGQRKCR
jgi:hypothetical protein